MSAHLDLIVESIIEEQCVLMLGPEVCLNTDGTPISSDLLRYFEEETSLQIEKDTDNLILFKDKTSKTFFWTELKKYYRKYKPADDIPKKLSQIPFHLIIPITNDITLNQCFDELGMEYDFHFYNKKQNPDPIKNLPSKANPLIYNLFGCIIDEDSLIVTNDDLFEFLFSVLGDKELPIKLKSALQRIKVFVFLGFDFEKWYLKLILRLFGLHQDAVPIASKGDSDIGEQTKNFYVNNFEMKFLDTNCKDFVKDLYKNFQKRGLLREIKPVEERPITTEIKDHLGKNEIVDALEKLLDYVEVESQEHENSVILQSNKYYDLMKKKKDGTISETDANMQLTKITLALLNIADELKNI